MFGTNLWPPNIGRARSCIYSSSSLLVHVFSLFASGSSFVNFLEVDVLGPLFG